MALAALKTWVNEILYPADLNAEFANIRNNPISLISPLTGNIDGNSKTITSVYISGRGATAISTSGIQILHNTISLVSWDSEGFDTDAFHNNSTNPTRLTAPVGGLYIITANVEWTANSNGERYLEILQNGVTSLGTVRQDAVTTGSATEQNLCVVRQLVAADYVEMRVFQNSGITLQIGLGNAYRLAFAISLLGVS